jgi:hypothetical protein
VGAPSEEHVYIFNGDFVDRGAWGVETLALLLAWKVALPRHVYLLRGNHESTYCTKYYGFQVGAAAGRRWPAVAKAGADPMRGRRVRRAAAVEGLSLPPNLQSLNQPAGRAVGQVRPPAPLCRPRG